MDWNKGNDFGPSELDGGHGMMKKPIYLRLDYGVHFLGDSVIHLDWYLSYHHLIPLRITALQH